MGHEVNCIYYGGSTPGKARDVTVTGWFTSRAGQQYWRGQDGKVYNWSLVREPKILGRPPRARIDIGPLA
eukprot:7368246-Karenia_brevis.AAC.1